jgi:hypothetical protein
MEPLIAIVLDGSCGSAPAIAALLGRFLPRLGPLAAMQAAFLFCVCRHVQFAVGFLVIGTRPRPVQIGRTCFLLNLPISKSVVRLNATEPAWPNIFQSPCAQSIAAAGLGQSMHSPAATPPSLKSKGKATKEVISVIGYNCYRPGSPIKATLPECFRPRSASALARGAAKRKVSRKPRRSSGQPGTQPISKAEA